MRGEIGRAHPLARAAKQLTLLAVCTVIGVVLTRAMGATGFHESPAFALATTALLAVGLYAGTHGIDLSQARRDAWLLARVLTVGVVLKAALIGVLLALVFGDARLLILGVVMAQIDPLSVSALEREGRLSPRAQSILRAWSSFDDPVTVLLAWLVIQVADQRSGGAGGLLVYVQALAVNLLLAGGVAVVFWATKRPARGRWASLVPPRCAASASRRPRRC
ncbi:cation:proton antiporter [Baekduia alba]|uniref:cation:proton antiporter domain-containing protein n=1 Tax=Baekduia alba TaxID=2997333 RepID=UPI00234003D3|nr:cation:proton antiporter [Baekduia alba]